MKGVIMAGGRGSRLMPLTADTPKPMIKLIDKPVAEYVIGLLVKHGITEIAMTLGYMAEKITEYFGDGSQLGAKLSYFYENEPLGTAGGVKQCLNYLSDDFVIISGDCYTEIDLTRAISFHFALNSPFTVICQPKENPVGLGVLSVDIDHKITSFTEKPETVEAGLVNTGIYVANKSVFKYVPDGFYDFGKQLLPRLVGQIYACEDYSYWSDIGTLQSYYATNARLAEKLTVGTLR